VPKSGSLVDAGRLAVTPVGVGTSYSAYGVAQTSFLVRAGDRGVLLDLGSGAFNRLQRLTDPEDLEAIVITHLHPDHCVDLFAMRVYMAWGPGSGKTVPVFGPAGLQEQLVDFTGGDDGWDSFRFTGLDQPAGRRDLGDGLVLRWQEVPHADPTFAIRLDWRGSSICFGADCGPNDVLGEFAAGVGILILECAFGTDPMVTEVAHLNARAAGAIAAAATPGRLLITHCYPHFDQREVLAEIAEEFDGAAAFAEQDAEVAA